MSHASCSSRMQGPHSARIKRAAWATLGILLCGASAPGAVVFPWAAVGDAGNAADTQLMNDGSSGYGAVAYGYLISKHEVTNSQYAEFLNNVDPSGANTRALYSPNMSSAATGAYETGGIDFNAGAPVGSKYSIKSGQGSQPVTHVSWNDAARFTNWLHNGQGAGSTENGVYNMSLTAPIRAAGATYVIPSENEWYKAAYYDPQKSGGPGYWDYATRTDVTPHSDHPSFLDFPANSANILRDDGVANGYDDGYALTGSTSQNPSLVYFTDVGAYTSTLSAYGTFDQVGNVQEWNETFSSGPRRGVRDGSWANTTPSSWSSGDRRFMLQGNESPYTGFRIALVPEPASLPIVLLLATGITARRARRRA